MTEKPRQPSGLNKPKFKMTVLHAAEHGSLRDLLVALRDVLAAALEDDRTQPRDISALVLRLKEISADIDSLDARAAASGGVTPADGSFDPSSI